MTYVASMTVVVSESIHLLNEDGKFLVDHTVPTSVVKFDQILPSFPFQIVTSKAVKKTRKIRKMLVEIVISD